MNGEFSPVLGCQRAGKPLETLCVFDPLQRVEKKETTGGKLDYLQNIYNK